MGFTEALFGFLQWFSFFTILFIIVRYFRQFHKANKLTDDAVKEARLKDYQRQFIHLVSLNFGCLVAGFCGLYILEPGDLVVLGKTLTQAQQKSHLLAFLLAGMIGLAFWIIGIFYLKFLFKHFEKKRR